MLEDRSVVSRSLKILANVSDEHQQLESSLDMEVALIDSDSGIRCATIRSDGSTAFQSLATSLPLPISETESDATFDEAQAQALSAFGIVADYGPDIEHAASKTLAPLTGQALADCGIQPKNGDLISILEGNEPEERHMREDLILTGMRRCTRKNVPKQPQQSARHIKKQRDFFDHFVPYQELFMELAKQMDVKSLLSLYSISKDFHDCLNGHMTHIMKSNAANRCLEASRIFIFNLYDSLCTIDPVGRPHPVKPEQIRKVPSLRWLAMVEHREKAVRDILACMAREGHRMPETMSLTLKKMWLTMDISTSARRVQLMHNEKYWTDNDIYNVQLFLIKLDMRFNDPIDGSGDDGLKKLFMGQKGLTPLRDLLKRTRFTSAIEILQLAARYAMEVSDEYEDMSLLGIPPEEIGRGHLEGWGLGKVHLYRMDELVLREAVRRNLELDNHMMNMLLWGYVDPVTKLNIQPSAEEMYMSDDDKPSLTKAKGNDRGKSMDDDTEMEATDNHLNFQGWETRGEDMAGQTDVNDPNNAAVIGPSGWRRRRLVQQWSNDEM